MTPMLLDVILVLIIAWVAPMVQLAIFVPLGIL